MTVQSCLLAEWEANLNEQFSKMWTGRGGKGLGGGKIVVDKILRWKEWEGAKRIEKEDKERKKRTDRE